MKKKFAFGAFILAITLVAVSLTILNNNAGSFQRSQSMTEKEEVLPEVEYSGGMLWEALSRHFISIH